MAVAKVDACSPARPRVNCPQGSWREWRDMRREPTMASVTGQKRTHLSLEKKVEVIRKSKDNPSIGLCALAEIFQCSKTQICAILKKKESILASYESNASTSKKTHEVRSIQILITPSMSGIVLLVLRTYIQMVHSSLKRLGRSLSVWVSMILLVLMGGLTSGSNVTILEKSQYVANPVTCRGQRLLLGRRVFPRFCRDMRREMCIT